MGGVGWGGVEIVGGGVGVEGVGLGAAVVGWGLEILEFDDSGFEVVGFVG
jgi:hypothetical protein